MENPSPTPVERSVWNLIAGHTEIGRNRCHLNGLERNGLQVNHATKFSPETVLQIIDGYWKIPACWPKTFPPSKDYPPDAPLLDREQEQAVANDLRQAFTHNTVAYAVDNVKSNLTLELFGDRCMAFLLSRYFMDELKHNGDKSAYSDLDHGGFD